MVYYCFTNITGLTLVSPCLGFLGFELLGEQVQGPVHTSYHHLEHFRVPGVFGHDLIGKLMVENSAFFLGGEACGLKDLKIPCLHPDFLSTISWLKALR